MLLSFPVDAYLVINARVVRVLQKRSSRKSTKMSATQLQRQYFKISFYTIVSTGFCFARVVKWLQVSEIEKSSCYTNVLLVVLKNAST